MCKKIVSFAIAILLISLFWITRHPIIARISVTDDIGNKLSNVTLHTFLLTDNDNVLVNEVKTNKSGYAKIRLPRTDSNYVNISLKAVSPNMQVIVRNLSINTNDKNIANVEMAMADLKTHDTVNYNELRVVNTANSDKNIMVAIGELHKIEGLKSTITFTPEVTNTMSTFINHSAWHTNGEATVAFEDTHLTVDTEDLTSSCQLESTFQFSHQYWELHAKSADSWQTIYAWEELIPKKLMGGIYQGQTVTGDNADYQKVINGDHGTTFDLTSNTIPKYAQGILHYETGFFLEDNSIGACSLDYGVAGLQYHFELLPGYKIQAYDNNTSQCIWYYTKKISQ